MYIMFENSTSTEQNCWNFMWTHAWDDCWSGHYIQDNCWAGMISIGREGSSNVFFNQVKSVSQCHAHSSYIDNNNK